MYALGAGGEGSVSLERTTATRSAIADAVKWVLVLEGDEALPAAPPNVVVNWLASTRTHISWGSSDDDLGVASYRLYRDGVLLAELPVTQTEYTDDDSLVSGESYGYSVEAIDYSGQSSGQTEVVSVTMPLTSVSVTVDNRDSGWSGSHSGLSGHPDVYGVDSLSWVWDKWRPTHQVSLWRESTSCRFGFREVDRAWIQQHDTRFRKREEQRSRALIRIHNLVGGTR